MKHAPKFVTAFILFLLPLSASAQGIDSSVVRTWERAWERVIDNALGAYLQRAADGPLAGSEETVRNSVLVELRNLLYPALSWESFGDLVIESMVAECGTEVLSQMTPYIVGDRSSAEIDPSLAQSYANCAQIALGGTMELVGGTIEKKLPDISEVYGKHGIQYP